MKTNLKALAGLVLISALAAGQAQTAASGTTSSSSKKTTARKHARAKKPAGPSVETQIEGLRQEFNSQIQTLKQQLSDRDAQLQAAQQAAAAAQATATQAQQAAQANQQALTDNTTAVTSLQGAVSDIKTNTTNIVSSIQDDQKQTRAMIESPSVLHYKGATLTPGGYAAGESIYRSKATGADIPTAFNALPFPSADASKLSEFYGSSRQSRLSLLVEGKLASATLRGYYEADFLGTGTSSNNNQSNSYVLRQRVVWAQAALNNGWAFTGGQLWSLATETKKGLSNFSGDIATPQAIDPNYSPGFVWTRQYGVRVTKTFGDKLAAGIAIENPQVLGPGITGSLDKGVSFLWGTPGANGGNYNGAASGASTTTSTCTTTAVPVTVTNPTGYTTTCLPVVPPLLTTYAINPTPDFLAKVAFDPGWGHYEIFGIARLFRDRVYPAATTAAAPAFNDTEVGGGIGGSARVPTLHKKLDLGIKGLWGTGVGRYGNSTIADVTVRPWGGFSPLHTFSALSTAEWHASPRLDVYANYGGDYVGKTAYLNTAGTLVGYGFGETNTTCQKEQVPSSANGGGAAFPLGPTGCSGNTRDVQEATLGYWYDFYKGPKGRLRQGIQYGYAERQIWADKPGVAPKGIENMVWTSFRYYLP
jgi:hypothetical protein